MNNADAEYSLHQRKFYWALLFQTAEENEETTILIIKPDHIIATHNNKQSPTQNLSVVFSGRLSTHTSHSLAISGHSKNNRFFARCKTTTEHILDINWFHLYYHLNKPQHSIEHHFIKLKKIYSRIIDLQCCVMKYFLT